eukprot:CAMPEP_0198132942 /NCGR_PEP_ID=MMETSP1442-20131203/59305_1 /TAXON_ID= /ORGANISM="Craspedostauros australis, Strain CCMP3328" /LENGTH=184 /DNA_ID=CAMNT_0043794045 /DNA_START=445 /DNA_END=999 /DNA_ORIENTATION=-
MTEASKRKRKAQPRNETKLKTRQQHPTMARFTSFLFLLATAANAFTVPPAAMNRATAVASPTAQNLIMTEAETNEILKKAEDCANSECSTSDVDDLVRELKGTEKELNARLEKIMNMIAALQHANDSKKRKKEEVRQFVSDMLRVFNTDKPNVFPTGFVGDIGDGPTTAYDAFPPKKWSPADKQ